MKIIISGGLGYIGGRLSKYFAEQGHTVIALSRKAAFLPVVDWPANLQVLHPSDLISDSRKLKGFDVFIHLAALNENDCAKYPAKAIEVNITETLQWLDNSWKAGVTKFIYFSTAHVYAKPLTGYFDEQTLTKPIHPYAITHKCAEDYVLAYATEKGMENLAIRLTNAFGGPAFPTADRWTLLVNDLCRMAVAEGKMTLLSDGLQMRDFICLEDVCAATAHLIGGSTIDKELLYNMSSGKSVTILDMALLINKNAEEFLGRPIDLLRKMPSENLKTVSHQISNKRLLSTGFIFNNRIDTEIKSTLKYFSENRVQHTNEVVHSKRLHG